MNRIYMSDTHFGHQLMADRRGYSSVEEHDDDLIATINRMVGHHDTVIHTGDFTLKDASYAQSILTRLKGSYHLVTGNHDRAFPGDRRSFNQQRPFLYAGFHSIQPFMRIKFGKVNVLVSHFPYDGDHSATDRYTQYRLRDEGIPVIHGHTHQEMDVTYSNTGTLQIHVGWDTWFRPVQEEEIREVLRRNGYVL